MLVFPQLQTGASAQYPIKRQLSQRTIMSAMEDGSVIALADTAARYLRWQIALRDLSDQELCALQSLFSAAQGNLLTFLFMDPAANLLAWSEDFSKSAWQTTGLTFDSEIADPMGGTRATRVHNASGIDLTVAQQTQIPGLSRTCLSVYLRANTPVSTSLIRTCGGQSLTLPVAVTSEWQRYSLSGNLLAVSDLSRFAIAVPIGTSFDIFGPQLDAQAAPSPYQLSTSRSGVYESARFDMKQFDSVATGPNRNTCVVYVRCSLPAGESL